MQQRRKIVIADDNKEICELITELLGSEGYSVDSVYDGYELLAYLEKNNPGVIILDLVMPNKDGLSILGTLREVSPNARIVIYTGYQQYKNSVYARSADKFLIKGGTVDELLQTINELA